MNEVNNQSINPVIISDLNTIKSSLSYARIRKRDSKVWTEEEDKHFLELKERQPTLPWQDFAEYFPGKTATQCHNHWYGVLARYLPHVGQQIDPEAATFKWTEEENRRFITLKQQHQDWSWETFAKYFPGHTVKQCWDHWNHGLKPKLIRKKQRIEQEMQKIMDSPLHHYEGAVSHFQEIQLKDPLLQSFQQETIQVLANIQTTYQNMKQRLTETDLQEAKLLANWCQTNTYYLETIYQHFLSYQASQESKEWYASQSEKFANLYLAFSKGKIDEMNFRNITSLKERDYHYQNLNNLFIQHRDVLKKYSSCFSLNFNKFMDESFFNIRLHFNFLEYAQQDWKSIASGLKEVLSRLQEITVFFQSFFNHISSIETEANIIARIKNEISLQDFYAKQAALMTVQKEGRRTEDSIPLHEPPPSHRQ